MTSDYSQLQRDLVLRLTKVIGIPVTENDVHSRFHDLGLTSIQVPAFLGELAPAGEQPLQPQLLWEYPTIAELAAYLSGNRQAGRPHPPTAGPVQRGEPIAVIGMSLRVPDAETVDAFWELLREGRESVREQATRGADPAASPSVRRWGKLAGIDRFDADAFAISPREAQQMDPQQRITLELATEALMDAGIAPATLQDSQTGVFVGAMWGEYGQAEADRRAPVTAHTATGRDTSVIAGRIAYTYGLNGPSLTINTACSSSLVAVHLACNSLRLHECDLALVGGINALLSPTATAAMAQLGVLSPRGICGAFAAGADGYVRSEGGGMLVLRRLSDALSDNDRILALLHGSAVNNDGFSNGLAAPSGRAQAAVMRRALQAAGVAPQDVAYVEAHGTGTSVGDPIEAAAIGAVYGAARGEDDPVRVGSVKTNVGHLESAAGVTGLIKVILAQQECVIPPSLHFTAGNPAIDFVGQHLQVVTKLQPWDVRGGRMLAGVSSFGFSGTNCHAIVEGCSPGSTVLCVLSADSPEELRMAMAQLRARLAGVPEDYSSLANLGYTLAQADRGGRCRVGLVAESRRDLLRQLDAAEQSRDHAAPLGGRGKLALLFSGNGGQWAGMGRSLLLTEPVFRRAVMQVDKWVRRLSGWSAVEQLLGGAPVPAVQQVTVDQTLLFAVQVGLAQLLQDWGVSPSAVAGQSLGEVSAAAAAGLLSMEDAVRVVLLRSDLQARRGGPGGMAFVRLPEQAVRTLLTGEFASLHISGSLSPQSTNISGDRTLVDSFVAHCTGAGIGIFPIDVPIAYHSPHMDVAAAELARGLGELAVQHPQVPMYSTVRPEPLAAEACTAAYWARNLREPVRLTETVAQMLRDGCTHFVEISPHPVLLAPLRECLRGSAGATAYGTLYRAHSGRRHLLQTLARLYEQGYALRIAATFPPGARLLPDLLGGVAAVADVAEAGPELFVLSAHNHEALKARARLVALWLQTWPNVTLREVAATSAHRDGHGPARLAVVASSRADLLSQLLADAGERSAVDEVQPSADSVRARALRAAGEQYLAGHRISWDDLYERPLRFVPLPGPAWRHERHWLPGSGAERDRELLEPESTGQNRTTQYYATLSEREQLGDFVRFGAFRQRVAGFSWLRAWFAASLDDRMRATALEAIETVRDCAFHGVDFDRVRTVLDIGCGYGRDLLWLGQRHSHLRLYGNNISQEQIERARTLLAEQQMADRVQIRFQDSARADLGGPYDLIFSFQVLHHIPNKVDALRNMARALAQDGVCVAVEIVSKLSSPIEHADSTAHFAPVSDWAAWLADEGLVVTRCIDASEAVAHYLHDPDFETNLATLAAGLDPDTVSHLRGPDGLGRLLERTLAGYLIFQCRHAPANLSPEELLAENRRLMMRPDSLFRADVAGVQQQVLLAVSALLMLEPGRIDPKRPLGEYGLDSMLALQLRAQVESLFRIRVPATVIYNYPSVAALGRYLAELVAPQQADDRVAQLGIALERELKDVCNS